MNKIYILLILLLLTGCSDNNNSSTSPNEVSSSFSIQLAPALSGVLSQGVATNSQLIIQATEPLDVNTITESSVYIQTTAGVQPDFDLEIVGSDIIIIPTVYLQESTSYEIVMTTAVATATGEHRSEDAVVAFTTLASNDTSVPTLLLTLPGANGDGYSTTFPDVEPYTTIYFQFSEAISPLSFEDIKITLQEDGSTREISGKLNLADDLISFIPDENLSNYRDYRVELNTSTLIDYAGNPYLGNSIEVIDFTIKGDNITPTSQFNAPPKLSLNAQANCLDSMTNYIFIGTNSGLDILEYNPVDSNLTLLSHTSDLGKVYSVKYALNANEDPRLYVGSSTGFTILDANLNGPNLLGHYDTKNEVGEEVPVYGISVDDLADHAYLAATTLGVLEINTTNELVPSFTQEIGMFTTAFNVSYDDGLLIVSNFNNDLIDIEISTQEEDPYGFIGHVRNEADYGNFSSLGVQGIGFDYYGNVITASYVTRISERGKNSCAIIRDIGVGFFNSTDYSPQIDNYLFTPFDVTMAGFVASQKIVGGGDARYDILLLSDPEGNIYLEEILD